MRRTKSSEKRKRYVVLYWQRSVAMSSFALVIHPYMTSNSFLGTRHPHSFSLRRGDVTSQVQFTCTVNSEWLSHQNPPHDCESDYGLNQMKTQHAQHSVLTRSIPHEVGTNFGSRRRRMSTFIVFQRSSEQATIVCWWHKKIEHLISVFHPTTHAPRVCGFATPLQNTNGLDDPGSTLKRK